ncbi:MAG TPA: DUF1287 domain-containing protein, partial [Saprospiraceae bacterium]|nr:DUF1287 domain-containing protein [Saprospiraceae bacterium]
MLYLLLLLLPFACTYSPGVSSAPAVALHGSPSATSASPDTLPPASPYGMRLSAAALRLTEQQVTYDPAYYVIPYPMGDVPPDRGVCTDVVIRAYRQLGVDLQQLVHEDMRAHFDAYPTRWSLSKPDPNIDHRRVPNLRVFFERKGASRPLTQHAADYLPGDAVTWTLPGGQPHIGLV